MYESGPQDERVCGCGGKVCVQLKRGIQLVLTPDPPFHVPLEILMESALGKGGSGDGTRVDELVLLY